MRSTYVLQHPSQLKNIIKFRSGLDLSIRNKSQDGQFYWTHKIKPSFLESLVFQHYTEKTLSVDCLMKQKIDLHLKHAISQAYSNTLRNYLKKSGLICGTGPTGS